MATAVLKRAGPVLELSQDGQVPLPADVSGVLARQLQFTKREYVVGKRGKPGSITVQPYHLFSFDEQGRLCCLPGHRHLVENTLHQYGYQCVFVDLSPPKSEYVYKPDWDMVGLRFEFRPRQFECLGQIAMYDGGIIDAVPAFGKSHLMAMIAILYPKAKIDVITVGQENVNGLVERIRRHVPTVGQVGCGRSQTGRVTVYSADSLHHSDYTADIVLADECHTLMTDRYAAMLARYWYARKYAFTATPDTRFDGSDFRMEGLFGPTIFRLDYPDAVQLGLVVPIVVQWLDASMEQNPCGDSARAVTRKRRGIWRHEERNSLIATAARSLVDAGLQTLILVETIEHGLYLRRHLPDFEFCYSEQGLGRGGDTAEFEGYVRRGLVAADEPVMTKQRRREMQQRFESREIMGAIATGVWSVGVSFDSLEALVRADGGASETANVQSPGRVSRIHRATGKSVGVVVDVLDNWDAGFRERSLSRRRSYAKRGWTQLMPDGTEWKPRGA